MAIYLLLKVVFMGIIMTGITQLKYNHKKSAVMIVAFNLAIWLVNYLIYLKFGLDVADEHLSADIQLSMSDWVSLRFQIWHSQMRIFVFNDHAFRHADQLYRGIVHSLFEQHDFADGQ